MNRYTAWKLSGIIILFLISQAGSALDIDEATNVFDSKEILCPDKIPNSPISWVLEPEYYPITVHRSIVFRWGQKDIELGRRISFPLALPSAGHVEMSGDVEVSVSVRSSTPILTVSSVNGVSSINLTYRLPLEKYAATFGRVQLSWGHESLQGLPRDLNVTKKIVIVAPSLKNINFADPTPSFVGDGQVRYTNMERGFLYFEGSGAKQAAQLFLIVLTLFLIVFIISSRRGHLVILENRLSPYFARSKTWILKKVPGRRGIISLVILGVAAFGLSLAMGPLSRVNVVVFTNPNLPFTLSGFSESHPEVFFTNMRYKTFFLMDRFQMLDAVLVDHWILPLNDSGLEETLEIAAEKGAIALLYKPYADENQNYFTSFETYEYSSRKEAEEILFNLIEKKKDESRFKLGYQYFKILAPILAVLSLLLVAFATFFATLQTIRSPARGLVLDAVITCTIFFLFFLSLVCIYIFLSNIVHMPLGWHGPSGQGLTIISTLGKQIGGGNWPRIISAGAGILAAVLFLSLARRIKISLWPFVAFTLMLYLVFQANPNISPIYARMVSGENDYTPPEEYLSRKGIDSGTRWMYRIFYGEILLYGTVLREEKILSTYSRGMAFGLAAASLFTLLRRVSPIMGSMLGSSTILIVSRFFTRIGDLDIAKTLWIYPAGMVSGVILVVIIYYFDRTLCRIDYFAPLAKKTVKGIPLIPVSFVIVSMMLISHSIVVDDILILGIGIALSGIAVASAESWRREHVVIQGVYQDAGI